MKQKINKKKAYLCDDLDPEVSQAFERLKKLLVENGCKLIEVDYSDIAEIARELQNPIVFYEIGLCLTSYLKEFKIDLTLEQLVKGIASPDVRSIFDTYVIENAPKKVPKEVYENIMNNMRPRLIDAV